MTEWLARGVVLSAFALLIGCGAGEEVFDPPQFTSASAATVVFGGGMVDAGQVDGKRYTVNDTRTTPVFKTWVEYFDQNIGRTTLSASAGGSNYAQGGASVAGTGNSLEAQVAAYTAGFGKDDIVIIGVGVQDIKTQVESVQAGKLTEAQAESNLREAASAYVDSVQVLLDKGAQTLLLTATHDLGQTKWAETLQAEALAGRLSALFERQIALRANDRYSGTAQQARILFVRITDVDSLIIGESAGFDEGNTPLCNAATESNVLSCTNETLVTDDEDEQKDYTYADHLYLSPAAHLALANYIRSYVNNRWGT